MATKQDFSFRANIRLKDLIGRGLILNDNVAVMELIKNAKDARSKRVEIIFENAERTNPKSIISIQDFGDGMSINDIKSKWLNIAFSSKRNENKKGGGYYAGEKGVGRFSCDRLGRELDIYSKRKDTEIVHMHVKWEEFEIDDPDKEISSVKFYPKLITPEDFEKRTGLKRFQKGTCLILKKLRSSWGDNELKSLKKELERFIIDPENTFKVKLTSKDIKNSKRQLKYDGYIENKLLERLDIKSVSIHASIKDAGKTIHTELRHYGEVVLSYEEANPFSELKDVRVQIHYLNPGSKISFKSITGHKSSDYGSIMLFLNGFRVMPYGEPKDDWLQLNQRKAQGTMRHLGTREIFGIVEVRDRERKLVPVTSREGVENNRAFKQLANRGDKKETRGFLPTTLRVLERYVVEGLDWDRVKPKNGEFSVEEIHGSIKGIIELHANKSELSNVSINEQEIREIAEEKIADYEEFIDDLADKLSNKSAYELSGAEKRDIKKYVTRLDSKLGAAAASNAEYRQSIKVEKKKRLFAESHLKSDSIRVAEFVHHIKILGDRAQSELKNILKRESSLPEEVRSSLESVLFDLGRIAKSSKVIARSGFGMMEDSLRHDIFSYVNQYIDDLNEFSSTQGINLSFENENEAELLLNFSPIEVTMLIDNILDNASVAKAKKLKVVVEQDENSFFLKFQNDGMKLTKEFDPKNLFEAGVSTTKNGSGIGLNQVRRIVVGERESVGLDGDVSIYQELGNVILQIRWDK